MNCCGLLESLQLKLDKSQAEKQHLDLYSLGSLLLGLACQNEYAIESVNESMAFVNSDFSEDFRDLLVMLLRKPMPNSFLTVFDVTSKIHHRILKEMNNQSRLNVSLESELAKEIQNGLFIFATVCLVVLEELSCGFDRPFV